MKSRRLHTLILTVTAASLLAQSVLAGAGSCGNCCSTKVESTAKSCCQKSAENSSCCAESTSCCSSRTRERTSTCCCDTEPELPPVMPDRHEESVKTSLEWLTLSNSLLAEPLAGTSRNAATRRCMQIAMPSPSRQTMLCVWQI